MLIRKLSAAAAVLTLSGLAAPVGGAGADTSPSPAPALSSPLISFVPPKVGAIGVAIGPVILGGKVMSPGLNVSTPGISVPPLTSTPTS